ncbi:RFCS2 [Enterospora canceri]|uniref:RFCS2 n=1 Tax=Enterospora canceri TaxID=1081671 RepID=A0A1Y1S5V5_9MICR|nr:RFCS2 [Enterospora canceri]
MPENWTETYRPINTDSFIGPVYLKNLLRSNSDIPHLLLYGPPGTGKTTFAKLISQKYESTLFLNGSDERGIDVIRNVVKKQAQYIGKKFIVLDECENLTRDSQTCLRRVLEDYNSTTFIFITNYISKIIDPIKSRTVKIKFNKVPFDEILTGIKIDLPEQVIRRAYDNTNGDLRKMLNVLQGVKYGSVVNVNVADLIRLVDYFCAFDCDATDVENENISALDYIRQLIYKVEDGESAIKLGELERQCLNGCLDEAIYESIRRNNIG